MGNRTKGEKTIAFEYTCVSRIYTSIYIWLESKINIYRHRSLWKRVLEIYYNRSMPCDKNNLVPLHQLFIHMISV